MQFDSDKLNKTRFDGTLGIISQVCAIQKLQNKCLSFALKFVRFSVLKFKVAHDHECLSIVNFNFVASALKQTLSRI